MGHERGGSPATWLSRSAERSELRGAAAGVVGGLGAFFLVPHLAAVAGALPLDLTVGLPMLVLSASLVYAGYWLLRSDLPCRRVGHVALWSLGGVVALSALTAWILGGVGGLSLDQSARLTIEVGTIGASSGLLAGLATERERRRRDRTVTDATIAAERAEDRFAYFNRVLRHHVLNGLAVVRGQAELLAEETSDPPEAVEVICRRSDEMADLIRNVETLGRAFTGDLERRAVDPLPALRAAIDAVESKHPGADVTASLGGGRPVMANERLHLVFEAVIGVAVEAAEDGVVDVTATTVAGDLEISLAFDGTLATGGETRTSGGVDMGRFLAETLLEYFGGGLVVRDSATEQVMAVRLPGAD